MIKDIKISNKIIGDKRPVFVIAEAGVNHNGSVETALKMVDAAAVAGADAIKFQTFKAQDVVTAGGEMVGYQIENIGKSMSQLEMIKALEFNDNDWPLIIKRCKKKKIIFLSTPHGSFNSVDLLSKLKVPAFKFGSGDLTNLPVLQYAARFGKPMILGTGMSTLEEVRDAIKAIKKVGNNQIIALHCTTNYPCPLVEVNLKSMVKMGIELNVLVGYSDHTEGILVSITAVAMGGCLIEKHFTLDRKMKGPDHKASLEPLELKKMIDSIKKVSTILGSEIKKPNKSELSMVKAVRKSIVASKDIRSGDVFSQNNLAIKRPGFGLNPKKWNQLLGKRAKKNYRNDEMIKVNEI